MKTSDWLMRGTHDEPSIDKIFVELCSRLRIAGVPVARASLHFRTHHPQWLGARIIWRSGMRNAEIQTVGYHVEATAEFLKSPLRAIIEGANEIRQRLQNSEVEILNHPLCEELRAEGLTDYIAWPLDHTLGKRHLVTFATDAPRGFDDDSSSQFSPKFSPALALVSEIRLREPACPDVAGNLCRSPCHAKIPRRNYPRQRRDGRCRYPDLRSSQLHSIVKP
jgi:adenylate cyclase